MKVKIKNVKVVPGGSLSKYWESDMQVVTTDKGKYIDNAVYSDYKTGHDWEDEIGCYVNVNINNSKGHKWINYKGKAKTTTYNDSNTVKDDDTFYSVFKKALPAIVVIIILLILVYG